MNSLFRRYYINLVTIIISPYSVEATVALLDAFRAQWPTIRDYGLRHPEIVPYVNQDYWLVCSFGIEGLPMRFVNVAGGWTGVTQWAKGADLEMEADLIHKNQGTYLRVFYQGSSVGVDSNAFSVFYGDLPDGLCVSIAGIGRILSNHRISQNTRYIVKLKNGEGFWLNGTKLATTTAISAAISGPMEIGTCGDIFYKVTVKDTANSINWSLAPYKTSNGKYYLVDLLSGTTQATGDGNPTVVYQYADGTPWTPPVA